MAVMIVGSFLSGCATHHQVDELKAEVKNVSAQNQETQRLMAHVDSVITSGAEADNRLRADMSSTVDELHREIATLLENYNDLTRKIDILSKQRPITHVLTSSPGAEEETPADSVRDDSPSIDCSIAYDEAFTLQLRGQYKPALERFLDFLSNCPEDENVANAHYWIGLCYYSTDKHVEAVNKFEFLIDEFKSSPKIADAYFMLGRSKLELRKTGEAKKIFQLVVDDFPGTFVAEQARDQLKELE